MILRVGIDLFAAALIAGTFAYGFTGNLAHEWIGLGACVAFAAHNALNRRWWRRPLAGTRTLNIALGASALATLVSGAMLSSEIFPFVPSGGGLWARTLHTSAAAWLFVLAAFHAGLHVPFFVAAAKRAFPRKTSKNRSRRVPAKLMRIGAFALAGTLALFGVFAFFRRAFPQKLFAQETFDAFAFDDSLPRFLADYTLIAALFFILAGALFSPKKNRLRPARGGNASGFAHQARFRKFRRSRCKATWKDTAFPCRE